MANSFANLVANLNLNIQNFSTNLHQASAQASQFANNLKGQINGGLVEPAKESKFAFKDVSRIVQGILISKAFYGGLNAIRNCTNAVWEFSQELEYAKIAYSNLFSDTALAEEFINVLEDFAATTPFSFKESEAAAKRLLAYGIQYKNVMYVMQGVLAASSMQNNPQVIESVSRAIGQIHTKGRLMNEEMRQLAEAGIPAYEILAEKLGLTQEQLQNLGNQAIPASIAINALVDGMAERFGGVVDASTRTMQGIISNIKDNATMVASGIFEPMYQGIKSVLYQFGQFLFTLREIYATTGIGGLFEAIFPEELHGTLRQFAANILVLLQAVVRLVAVLGSALKPVLQALLRMFNAFVPIIVVTANALSALVGLITSNATAMKILTAIIAAAASMWVLFKLKGLASAAVAGAISLISKALAGLSAMLTFVVAHPFWSLMLMLGGLLVGLSGGFGKLSNAISGVFKNLTKIGGVDPDKLLLPSQEERANDLNKFNNALDGTSESMDELADSTGKATKAAKGLLSFDEVFKLNQPDEGTGGGGIEIEMPDLSGVGGGLNTDMIDFEGFAEDYVTKLIKSLKEKILGAGIGAIVGGLLGSALGGAKGAKLGAAIGALAGWFWGDIADKLGLSDTARVTVPIATGLGAAIGKLYGHPIIGAGIGALVGWIVSEVTEGVSTGDWSGVGLPVGIGLGAAIGKLVGHPIIGAGIGALVGDIINQLIKGFTTGEWNFTRLSAEMGIGLGAGIGALVGHPIIGAAIGALVGWIIGLIIDNWAAISQWFSDVGDSIGEWISGIADAYNTWATDVENTVNTWCDDTFNAFTTWVSETATAIGDWISDSINGYNTWAENTETAINNWCDNTWNAFIEWCSDVGTAISTWFDDMLTTASNGLSNIGTSITTWISDLWSNIWGQLTNIGQNISNWWNGLWDGKTANVNVNADISGGGSKAGHAAGGVFNREHLARFAEGNKAEAIIPLETESAMQPFVDAVANGLTSTLMPLVANISGGQQQLQPLYVGTLIADERSLRELERKMQVIRMQETKRRG